MNNVVTLAISEHGITLLPLIGFWHFSHTLHGTPHITMLRVSSIRVNKQEWSDDIRLIDWWKSGMCALYLLETIRTIKVWHTGKTAWYGPHHANNKICNSWYIALIFTVKWWPEDTFPELTWLRMSPVNIIYAFKSTSCGMLFSTISSQAVSGQIWKRTTFDLVLAPESIHDYR